MLAGWLLPSRFKFVSFPPISSPHLTHTFPSAEPPFDRHDWIVRRPSTNEEVRYVIDYYSAPPEPDGTPVFSLDVRPALDNLGSIKTRISMATEEAWAEFRAKQANASRSEH